MLELLLIVFIIIIFWIFLKKENYQYATLYNAYELPFTGDSFIAAGSRPVLGHYVRLSQDDGQSLIEQEYENKRIKGDICNVCMVKCLNPTSVVYKDKKKSEIIKMCANFCKKECVGRDMNAIAQEAGDISEDQLKHDIYHHERYTPNVFNYFDQGGWRDFPEWMN